MLWPRGVSHRRGIEFARPGGRPLRLDVYLPTRAGERAAPGHRPGARRRLDRRQPLGAGHPAAQPPRQHGWVGFNIDYRLSPQATFPDHVVDVKRGDRLGPRARGRVRRRPGLHLHHRRLGRRSPVRARGADRRRPEPAARVRGRRHLAWPPRSRSTASTTSPTPRACTTASCSSGCSSSSSSRRSLEEDPELLPRRLADLARACRRAAVLRPPRRPRHARPGRRRAPVRRRAARRLARAGPLRRARRGRARLRPPPELRTARVVETIERFLATVRAGRGAVASAELIG